METKDEIRAILGSLEAGQEKPCDLLEQLRSHASLVSPELLLMKRVIAVCCHYGFSSASPTARRIALRCACNTMLRAKQTRQIFSTEEHLRKTVEMMMSEEPEDEFISARLLLLCTYETNANLEPVFEEPSIPEVINTNLSRYAKLVAEAPNGSLIQDTSMSACNESLKLLYNLTACWPDRTRLFSGSLLPVLQILNQLTIDQEPLQPPISLLVNALVNLIPKQARDIGMNHLFPQDNSNFMVDRLLSILDLATQAYGAEEMERLGPPLVQVLLQVAELATPSPKEHLCSCLLPSKEERQTALGTGSSLPSRLLRLSNVLSASHLRQLIPALLFELSGKDVETFVHNIGFGFAAGFLVSQGLKFPTNTLGQHAEKEVNPITGQRRDLEPHVQTENMTDEEKEREAERLFVLFQRLQSTGVVDFEHPVAEALHAGRLE